MPLDYSQMAIPKQKKKKKKSHEPTMGIRDKVKARDHNRCQVCGREATSLHHIILRSNGGRNDVENLVCLCSEHHTGGPESPHQSEKWRRYWEKWAAEKYPDYWRKIKPWLINEVRGRA